MYILEIKNAKLKYKIKTNSFSDSNEYINALNDVSLKIKEGEILGLVGESGCGKSTLGKSIVKLLNLNFGLIKYKNCDITKLKGKELKNFRKDVSMIFQNPYASLNPRMSVKNILLEPLEVFKIGNKKTQIEKVKEIATLTGLDINTLNRYPSEFSGGQRQRIAIARALMTDPRIIIADEPVSALDVSIQAQIINLLLDLKEKLNLTLIFISHDLSVIRYISNTVAVMYLGQIVELASKDEIFNSPKHPYTKLLMSSAPGLDKKSLKNKFKTNFELPSLKDLPKGCKFFNRCFKSDNNCKNITPDIIYISENHFFRCHYID